MKRRFNPQMYVFFGLIVAVLIAGGYALSKDRGNETGAPAPSAGAMSTFSGEDLGFSFKYPSSYTLEKREIEISGALATYLTLMQKDIVLPEAGEGPPGITVAVFPNVGNLELSAWLSTMTNAAPTPSGGWDFTELEVDGEEAIAYTSTGLYESDNVAVVHGGRVYVFSAAWLTRDDQTLRDLDAVLRSVAFK